MTTIVQKDNPVLRQEAQEVDASDFGTDKLKAIIADMKEALAGEHDGVAIAAPQIGVSKQIFIVSHKVFQHYGQDGRPVEPVLTTENDKVFINPTITKLSSTRESMEEGCLSVRWWYGHVERATKARVRALDENGKVFELGGSGLLAQIFQHETDHLHGVLFTDKATDLQELDPETLKHHHAQ